MDADDRDGIAETLATAIFADDRPRIVSMLREDTRLGYDGEVYRGGDVDAWLDRIWPPGTMQIQPIKFTARGSRRLATVVGCAARPGGDEAILLRTEWTMTVQDGQLVAVDVGPLTRTAVPPVIVAYIRAKNDFNLGSLLETFADDALVNDQLRDYWGKEAITEWAANEIIGERVTMAVVGIVEHYNSIIVTAHVDGDYDKRGLPDPLVLAFYFSAQGDKIVQLIILRNIVDV